jgi:hypothetical protein
MHTPFSRDHVKRSACPRHIAADNIVANRGSKTTLAILALSSPACEPSCQDVRFRMRITHGDDITVSPGNLLEAIEQTGTIALAAKGHCGSPGRMRTPESKALRTASQVPGASS